MSTLEGAAGLVSEHPSALNVLNGPKYCTTLQKQTFIVRFHHCDLDGPGKRSSYPDLKS